ncbi:L-lactate permease [Granulibacter bethesdensis]|uniref:L-lactate permease n=1 Tax=Granulibacter bethesdensis (strain ATCC BAA-1260 / CGDNIH1) TaxID=391165 RepID=Q0BU19_GRABC|nr:L-lactate permease [Granulibacter bethesdensis]ABI61683.1 L-lactate permease [Granulibacter bethesdensis CGDNIH1]AHJ66830.1 L-lactate permease [Granulibacter bethesdensis CGDNIH4]AHJ69499.1 L-lactate permease [Granulibacter bethesdensis]APH51489.1 L-lactate permease [Granulibacter bethesdensis]APH59112.1 L-lactate permease [Granulibacter bethesdensis]
MFQQVLRPVSDSLPLSFLVAILPIATVLILLGVVRRPAWQASLAGLVVGLLCAVLIWQCPPGIAFNSIAAGMTFALWPVMWIVFNALVLYNVAVQSRRFDAFRDWVIDHLPDDRRVVLIVIGFCFGALMEGVSGFGTPIAITSALLVLVGFPPIEALTYTLIFNTAPVAFGALGAPVTVLGQVTSLPDTVLASMVGRQLPLLALLLPFYVMAVYGGLRSVRALWPVLLVSGSSFALGQFVSSNFIDYKLTDVLSSLSALAATIGFLRIWQPEPDPAFRIDRSQTAAKAQSDRAPIPSWQGWLPWLTVSAVVIIWTSLRIFEIGAHKIPWPGLDHAVFITLYGKPYAANWVFQPLASGTAILLAAILTSLMVGIGPRGFLNAMVATWRQTRIAILTVALIIGLAYLMNYSGMTYTLGLAVASVGPAFPILSAFLGWIAVFLSGSDTSGNALFGNLQVVAANQLHLNPVLFAATNSSGGVMGKMISPQNIATGVATTNLKGQEGAVLARTFWHSIILTLVLGMIVVVMQYVTPWIIPE